MMNATQAIDAKNFLCNNLFASDLRSFLISTQEQLDKTFLVEEFTRILFIDLNSIRFLQATMGASLLGIAVEASQVTIHV
jgi:hypothetical protein